MYLGAYPNFTEAYFNITQTVKYSGVPYTTRDQNCIEIRPASFELNDPRNSLYVGSSRRLNMRFFAVETLSYIAGWGTYQAVKHANLMCAANSRHEYFRDKELNGLWPMTRYGDAISHRLTDSVVHFGRDKYSRQVVIPIWSPNTRYGTQTAPCTVSLEPFVTKYRNGEQFMDRFDMLVHMRSNDLNWGTPYDIAAFSVIQCGLADILGIPVGKYHHVAGSLHLYEATPPKVAMVEDQRSRAQRKGIEITREIPKLCDDATTWIMKARDLLGELHEQIVEDKKPWSSYDHSYADEPYWAWWGNLIRFSWGRLADDDMQ